MIKEIPISFRDKNEPYFVIESLQKFCKNNNLKTTLDKVELINEIVEFANLNDENENNVLSWIDKSLKEGIKKVIVTTILNSRELMNKSKEEWKELIYEKFNRNESMYIINGKHTENIELCGYNFIENKNKVEKVSLTYTVLLKEEKNRGVISKIIYPIFIDVDLKNKYIIGRAKSKTKIYRFKKEDVDDENLISTTYEKMINEAISKTMLGLNLEEESKDLRTHKFKGIIHSIVAECTKTPDDILKLLSSEENNIKSFVEKFFLRKGINFIKNKNLESAIEDINVFMEKYISINYEDKGVFTSDRYAYPIQISATDSDFSSVDESTCGDKPLQCTPIFFDNKKLIQREKKCDNVEMVFKREPEYFFTAKSFPVILEVKRNRMYMDFRKYTLEEDIENVLSRVIRNN